MLADFVRGLHFLDLKLYNGKLGNSWKPSSEAEEREMLHLDIKSENKLVTDEGIVRIVDFGQNKDTPVYLQNQTEMSQGKSHFMANGLMLAKALRGESQRLRKPSQTARKRQRKAHH